MALFCFVQAVIQGKIAEWWEASAGADEGGEGGEEEAGARATPHAARTTYCPPRLAAREKESLRCARNPVLARIAIAPSHASPPKKNNLS